MLDGYEASAKLRSDSRATATARPRFSPSAIQSLEVLALPVTELDAYAKAAVERNPLLEIDYDASSLAFEELPLDQDDQDDQDASERDDVPCPPPASLNRAEGFDLARLRDDLSETETLRCFLRAQLDAAHGAGRNRAALDAVIEAIDDDGYFAGSVPVIAAELGCPPEDVEAALSSVQGLSPRGVGARTLAECLGLQLDDDEPLADLVRTILAESLDDLAGNRTTRLMRTYRITLDDLARIRDVVCSLDPRPGASFSQRKDTVYVIPDLVVERAGSALSVRVVGELSCKVVRNAEYDDMIERGGTGAGGDADAAAWLSACRAEADRVLANIEQRSQTLMRFGVYLAEAQYGFFFRGEACMKPLTMQQAADALGFHVSTISRIVQDKHVLTPQGVFPLKHFFASSIPSRQGGRQACSSLAVKSRIREIVAREDSRKPLSDEAITRILNDEGIDIKRRTVAKYREALGIGRQSQRRR